MASEIKGIIFDYGNVLCEPQEPHEVQAMADALELELEPFKEKYWRDRRTYDRADLGAAEYWNRIAGRELSLGELGTAIELDNKGWLHRRERTLAWVGQASRMGLRTGLLSNLPVSLRDALEQVDWLPQFDVRTYSCTLGRIKPEPEIYADCVGGLGLKPDEVVFLDDRPENVRGADEVGLHGLLFESADQAASELAGRYRVSLL
ncbi:MAG: HAD family phosphatase [Bryobacteraceae bacterium]|jgi:putative hydrolase of the HAD superfamily